MPDHHPIDEAPQTPTDEGLRCPECEYNLTGLADEVCPECGEAFDRAKLLASLSEAVGPIPVWSRRHEIGLVRAFLATLVEMWFSPLRFGRRFPRNPEPIGPRWFARICLGVSFCFGILAFCFAPRGGFGLAQDFFSICIGAPVSVALCETLMAGILFSAGRDDAPDRDVYDAGLALARMGRSYLVLNSFILALFVLIQLGTDGRLFPGFAMWCTLAGAAAYWWICMVLIVAGHNRRKTDILNTLVVLPIVAGFSLIGGVFAVFLFGILGMAFGF